MPKNLIIFEDKGFENLLPLTYTRPGCMLRCGILTLAEKIIKAYRPDFVVQTSKPDRVTIHTRDYLAGHLAESLPEASINEFTSEDTLLINGRLIASKDLAKAIPIEGKDMVYMKDGEVLAARINAPKLKDIAGLLKKGVLEDGWIKDLPKQDIDRVLIHYPWDLITHTKEEIVNDFENMGVGGKVEGKVHPSAILEHKDNIYIGKGATIHAGAILQAEEGPIYIGESARVMAGAVLEGPIAVGRKSRIKMLAKIYEGTSIGEYCKIGGEVEESIFQGYTNKQHDGFLGHSYLGEWINLGADTNNSDLKNNYSPVKVTINGKEIDTKNLFVGLIMGDHSKTGINTMFNTGTVVGVGCNIYGSDFPPKYLPSFMWGDSEKMKEHDFEKFLRTAERVLARRDKSLTPALKDMLKNVFELTKSERKEGIRKG